VAVGMSSAALQHSQSNITHIRHVRQHWSGSLSVAHVPFVGRIELRIDGPDRISTVNPVRTTCLIDWYLWLRIVVNFGPTSIFFLIVEVEDKIGEGLALRISQVLPTRSAGTSRGALKSDLLRLYFIIGLVKVIHLGDFDARIALVRKLESDVLTCVTRMHRSRLGNAQGRTSKDEGSDDQ
jgi:hypothetical protein